MYSRAVVQDGWIFVSGTMGVDAQTGAMPDDFTAQAQNSFRIIENALEQAGASLADVAHVRIFVSDRQYLREMVIVLQQKFTNVMPAQTMLIAQMPNEAAKLEIEVIAKARD
ncbi:MAG: Rid family hydrolase [Rhizomicrobium sp.]